MKNISITKGLFDTSSNKEFRIVSFTVDTPGGSEANIIVLRIDAQGVAQGWLQTLGPYRTFSNRPEYFVRGEKPFFVVKHTPIGESCSPFQWSEVLYQLEDKQFRPVWSTEYYHDGHIGKSLSIENTYTEIRFEDIDGDGNQEIIQEGTQTFCSASQGGCYSKDCDAFTGSHTIRRIFHWNPTARTFEERG